MGAQYNEIAIMIKSGIAAVSLVELIMYGCVSATGSRGIHLQGGIGEERGGRKGKR